MDFQSFMFGAASVFCLFAALEALALWLEVRAFRKDSEGRRPPCP